MNRVFPRMIAVAVLTALVASCADKSAQLPAYDSSALEDKLVFLQDGRTTREDVLLALGPPSGEFDGGNIWTYGRLDLAYHLVVIFSEQDVVRTHRIVKVK